MTESDDEDLAIRMMDGDKDALREVLREYLEPIKEVLDGKYGTTVQQADIDGAVNGAIMKLWQKAGEFNKKKGTLGSWLYTMAESAVIDVYRREKKLRKRCPILPDDYDVAEACEEEPPELTKAQKQYLKDLDHIIETKLPPLQKAIVKADLVVGGTADAGSLAELHSTSKNSIYVSRNKAHETIRREMTKLAQECERLRGKK
ncbi:RNA polymerase factor sigma-70 [Botrimarina colliarenosi]|uniref:RNA polymerase factor sigma-70 n=1 Tax=Botrimarina colliarenosi TaxID=2528001 RepID=A0A5C6ALZ9_9BACT|nr:sigma factor [Botrimarina colliarenosi]TWU00497.1 RNA polymerase factor sigma-70 [Botrimarina colliarenosi]